MKILFLSHKFYPDVGGIEVNSEILANYFVKFGAEVHLLTWSQEGTVTKDFPFAVIRNPGRAKLLSEHKWADVVFENNPSLKLSWLLLVTGKPHVVAIRTWISRMDGTMALQDKLKLKWIKRANAVIAVSKMVKELTFKDAVVIGNPYREHLFVDLHLDRDKDFVFLGRLVSDKGADMAIDLIKKLSETDLWQQKKYTLTIIGDGPEKEQLEKMVKEYNLTNYVTFTGMLGGRELTEALNAHKYLLAPSRWKEPFGNIALEGMACGCLPIVSDGGGLIDAIGDAGIQFERNSIDSLFKNVSDLLVNPQLEVTLRGRFKEHLKNHQPEFVAGEYYNVIKRVIDKDGKN